MQKYLFILCFFFFGCAVNQSPTKGLSSTKTPFQIIDAFGAFSSEKQKNLQRYQYLYLDDTISINEYGHLIIAHYSGKLLELSDTTFSVNTLANSVAQSLAIVPNQVMERVDINDLWKYKRHNHFASASYCYLPVDIKLHYPASSQITISTNDPILEFNWSTDLKLSGKYVLQVTNIYDEVLELIETKETSISVDFNQYPYVDPKLFLVEIFDKEDHDMQSSQVGIMLNSMYDYTPKNSHPKSAIEALELAFYLKRLDEHDQAKPYFQQATQLSDLYIYHELNSIHN